MRVKSVFGHIVFILLFSLMFYCHGFALSANEVLVVANKNAARSVGLAKYYMEKRQIPEENLVLLFMTDKETCTREDYLKKAVPPIRRFLEKNPDIRAIVTLYGLPIRIASPGNTPEEAEELSRLSTRKKEMEDLLAGNTLTDMEDKKEKTAELKALNRQIQQYRRQLDKVASFDSELMAVKRKDPYPINMWQPNPFFLGFRQQKTLLQQSEIMMTSRLDGADPDIVKRIIDDSIEAEKTGVKGDAYFDARWKKPKEKKPWGGYAFYDQSIHLAADNLSTQKSIRVILNDDQSLFKEGSNYKTALYCGWYRLANYVDAFNWQKGSVGFHIASSECATLKGNSNVWCKKMLDKGIAATVGPVGEPYVQAFPVPEIFFRFLTEGVLTLAESYLVSQPFLSWKMVLVGDPLYRFNLKS